MVYGKMVKQGETATYGVTIYKDMSENLSVISSYKVRALPRYGSVT